MHAVPLAARKLADLLLLVRPLEVEPAAIGAAVHLAIAELDLVEPARDLLPDVFLGIERVAALIHIAELHGVAEPECARVRRLLADDHLEQRRLARAVRADHADDAAGRQ